MVEFCEDDSDEAAKEIKWHMFQQTEAWVRSFNKAMKSAKVKLRQAVEIKKLKQDVEVITDSFDERLELQRARQEREWLAKLTAKDRVKAEQRVNFQWQYDGECKMKETDVVDEAAEGNGGGVDTFVIGMANGGTVDGMVVEGSKPSTKVVVGVGVGRPVKEECVTAPI
ncbi:hypothetical protein GIB67_011626 [Kingdonia uniflora]|uniref:Uncharacterized protein n=1 Tax=Kingdonia uniflora TaxID=39325 RepID=A0A7J7NLY8_9MAGN|nr:hypothetical protein GIB67_011626 [Kingdonia uniflora]